MYIEEGLERVLVAERRVMALKKSGFFVLPLPSPLPILAKQLSSEGYTGIMMGAGGGWVPSASLLPLKFRNSSSGFAHLESLQVLK